MLQVTSSVGERWAASSSVRTGDQPHRPLRRERGLTQTAAAPLQVFVGVTV